MKNEYSKSIISNSPNHNFMSGITVIVTGFNHLANTEEVEAFMNSVCENHNYDIKVNNDKCFRGFVYILFDTEHEAAKFMKQDIYYDRKLLNMRISKDYDVFIEESIENLRWPKKIFVDRIPKM